MNNEKWKETWYFINLWGSLNGPSQTRDRE